MLVIEQQTISYIKAKIVCEKANQSNIYNKYMHTIKLIKPIDYDKTYIIKGFVSPNVLFGFEDRIFKMTLQQLQKDDKKVDPRLVISNMFARWNYYLIEQSAIGTVLNEIADNFEIEYDEEQVKKIAEGMEKNNSSEEDKMFFIKKTIKQNEILKYLGKEWGINVSDQEVDQMLDSYYEHTNKPVREIKNDKEKFESARNDIIMKNVLESFREKFSFQLQLDLPKKQSKK